MTEEQAKTLVKLAVIQQFPNAPQDADAIAQAALNVAVINLGKLDSVDFNAEFVTETLTSGTARYTLGVDLFPKFSDVWNIQEMGRTDVLGWPINVVGLDDFRAHWRGYTASAPPQEATIYKRDGEYILEVAPTPDSNYPIEARVKHSVTQFDKIPEPHHDTVVLNAITIVSATRDPQLAVALSTKGKVDLQNDSATAWDGSVIRVERSLGANTSGDGTGISSWRVR